MGIIKHWKGLTLGRNTATLIVVNGFSRWLGKFCGELLLGASPVVKLFLNYDDSWRMNVQKLLWKATQFSAVLEAAEFLRMFSQTLIGTIFEIHFSTMKNFIFKVTWKTSEPHYQAVSFTIGIQKEDSSSNGNLLQLPKGRTLWLQLQR